MPSRLIDHINSFRADILCLKVTTAKPHTANSTYEKLTVQCIIEALCPVSSSVLAESFLLRNRQLLVAANRYRLC